MLDDRMIDQLAHNHRDYLSDQTLNNHFESIEFQNLDHDGTHYKHDDSNDDNNPITDGEQKQQQQQHQQNATRKMISQHVRVGLMKKCAKLVIDNRHNDDGGNVRPSQSSLREKKSWFFGQPSNGHNHIGRMMDGHLKETSDSADAERLDSIWKDLKGIRYKKQNGKIVQIKSRKNRNSANSNNKDSRLNKRMILFLLNLSVAKPLLERIQSKQQLKRLEEALKLYGQIQQQKNESRSTSSSSLDHLSSQTPFDAESFSNSNLDLLSQQSIEENESDFMPSMFGTHFTRSPQSFPSSMMTTATMKVTTPIATKTNHQHETGQTTVSQSSRLVETDRPMLETPRSKKLLSQTMILRANPWDKEGIRFKRNIFNHQSRIDLSSQTGKFSLTLTLSIPLITH